MDEDRRRRQSLQMTSAYSGEVMGISNGCVPEVPQDTDSRHTAARFNTGSFSGRRFNQNLPEEGSGEEEQPQQHPLDSEVSHDVSPTSASEPAMRSSSSANRSQHLSHSSTGVSKGHDAMLPEEDDADLLSAIPASHQLELNFRHISTWVSADILNKPSIRQQLSSCLPSFKPKAAGKQAAGRCSCSCSFSG
ncbi:MAG: hypothetical protein WDW38_003058 [Sanguina aurantia]